MSVAINYYIVKVMIVECDLTIKLKNYSFPDILVCLYEFFSF